jgi:fermentation-respiration switch protein FrsA (DUF1100 family)
VALLLAAILSAGCTKGESLSQELGTAGDWLDHPRVLAVTFHPRRERMSKADGFERLEIPVGDGAVIGGRFYAAATNAPTVLFFHGNGEIVDDYHDVAGVYRALGINFMPFDYRGYGLSTGTPTVGALLADARASEAFARSWLADRGYRGRLIVMGRSLGSAAALELAAACGERIDGLIVDSGFAHLAPLLRRLGAPVPEDADGGDRLVGQLEKIRRYDGPTLIIHGALDFIIPIGDALDLQAASPSADKRLLRIEGAGHNDVMAVAGRAYFEAVSRLAWGGTP